MPTKIQSCLSQMPPLPHSIKDEVFDVRKSESLRWVLDQEVALEWIWDRVRQSGAVEFNQETGLWRGIEVVAEPTGGRPRKFTDTQIEAAIALAAPDETKAVTQAALHRLTKAEIDSSESTFRKTLVALFQAGRLQRKLGERGWLYWATSTPGKTP